MMRLTWPSTAPELQGRLSPLATASWSARRPVTTIGALARRRPGAAVIHGSSSLLPWRSFMMAAKSRTLAVTAARIAPRLARSASASRSGLVMIQLVTARTFGGAGTGAPTTGLPLSGLKITVQGWPCRYLRSRPSPAPAVFRQCPVTATRTRRQEPAASRCGGGRYRPRACSARFSDFLSGYASSPAVG
jgi:hypothetical protein